MHTYVHTYIAIRYKFGKHMGGFWKSCIDHLTDPNFYWLIYHITKIMLLMQIIIKVRSTSITYLHHTDHLTDPPFNWSI